LAFELEKQNGNKNPFLNKKEAARKKKWLKKFLNRNSKLSLRTKQGQYFSQKRETLLL
jgi:hypothetical protein